MSMDNWDDLKYVLAMIRHGTMSAAARYLGSNVATVSRRIERLSQDLDTPLFEKRGQTWVATDAAVSLAELAEGFDQSLRSRLDSMGAGAEHQPVTIEIAAPPAVHAEYLIPRVEALTTAMPHVRLTLCNKVYAQGLGEADIQIRIGRPEGGRLKAKKFCDFDLRVYEGEDHVRDGRWIGISQKYPDADALRDIYREANASPTYRVDEMPEVLQLVKATGLPGLLPDFLAEGEPGIRMSDLPGNHQTFELWIAYHETRHGDQTLKGVFDWACENVGVSRATAPRPARVQAMPPLHTAAE